MPIIAPQATSDWPNTFSRLGKRPNDTGTRSTTYRHTTNRIGTLFLVIGQNSRQRESVRLGLKK